MNKIFCLFALAVLFACKSNQNNNESSGADSVKSESFQTEYTCSMHPEIVSDKAGKCPHCGMELQVKS
jgi:hypothetical protein